MLSRTAGDESQVGTSYLVRVGKVMIYLLSGGQAIPVGCRWDQFPVVAAGQGTLLSCVVFLLHLQHDVGEGLSF